MENTSQSKANQGNQNPDKGINNWNERLDENLEPNAHNDVIADEKAKEFSEKHGSGDQSDEADQAAD